MLGFGIKGKAKNLYSVISRFSGILSGQKEVFPSGGNVKDIECLLTGISCFLVTGFANDNNLAYELVPTYQKAIMPTVNKNEFDSRTKQVQEYYEKYRNRAIDIQEGQDDWFWPLMQEFGRMMADDLNANKTKASFDTLSACIVELISKINPNLGL